MADQLRYDAQGYANPAQQNRTVFTPALDRIASEGVSVRYSWSSTPTCTPARAALLTGQRPWGHGMLGYGAVAQRYELTFPRVLAAAGYRTASMGKDHFGWNATSDSGVAHGYAETVLYDGLGSWDAKSPHHWNGEYDNYDRYFQSVMPGKDPQATLDGLDGNGWNTWHGNAYVYNESYHATAWLGRQAEQFIRSYPTRSRAHAHAAAETGVDQATKEETPPFLLKVSFHRPHSPYDPPQRLLDRIDAAKLAPMARCDSATPWCNRFRGNASLGDPQGCENTADAWCGEMPSNDTALSRRAYLASVAFVDEQVGRIYAALEETGQLENTFIIWTADHGDGQGDMYHWRKGYPYEFSAHVPMLLRWPANWEAAQPEPLGVQRGTVLQPPIVTELRDVFHTVVDAAGVASNASLVPRFEPGAHEAGGLFASTDGKSMLCLLKDPTGKTCDYAPNPGPWRQWLDLEHSTCYNMTNHWSALTDGRMKYVFRAWAGDEQLFNLTADPTEKFELSGAPEYSATLALWRSRMVAQFQREQRGLQWVSADGKLLQREKSVTYGPNFPTHASPTPAPRPSPPVHAGDAVYLEPNGGGTVCNTNDCWVYMPEGELQLLQFAQTGAAGPLCLAAAIPADVANATGANMVVAKCATGDDAQRFSTRNHTASTTTTPAPVVHTKTGMCVAALGTATGVRATLAKCDATSQSQNWVFGASGRLCNKDAGHLCLHAGESAGMLRTITEWSEQRV